MVSKVPNAEIAPFSTEVKTRHFGIHNSTSTTKNLVLFALKTNAKTCKFDKEMFLWILELCLCMTDGARQVSFSNQNFFPLLSSLLPSKHEQKHASNKQKKLLEGVGKKKTKTFPAQNLKIALSLHWNQRQFSSFQAPLLSLSSAKATKSFRKKNSKAKSKNFPSLRSTRLRLGKPTRRTIATEGQAI